MRTALICKTPPQPFIQRADVKKQLKIAADDTGQDDLLDMYIGAACGVLDGADGRLKLAVAPQAWELVLPSFFPSGRCQPARIELPLPPIRSVTSVKYFDNNGVQQTLDVGDWRLVNRGSDRSRIVPAASWPSTPCREDAVSIAFVAGFSREDGDGFVPMPLQIAQAAMLMVKGFYDLGQRNAFLGTDTVFGVGSRQYAVSTAAADVVQRAVDNLLSNIALLG